MNENRADFTHPLPQKADYNIGDHLIYGNQKKSKKILEWILTILAWAVLLSYVIYLIYGAAALHFGWYLPQFAIYNSGMILEIGRYFRILFFAGLIVALLMIIWKNYNLRRFGRLHRRKFRPPVQNEELCEMFQIDADTLQRLQTERVVVLEKNIIPEALGMGRQRKKED